MSPVSVEPIAEWDASVTLLTPPQPSMWSQRYGTLATTDLPPIDILRTSASRPWLLEQSTPTLWGNLRYPGPIRQILVESFLERESSEACVRYGLESGHFDTVAVIDPQRGQGYAIDYAIRNLVTAPYMLKWDDDFDAVVTIPLDTCVRLMETDEIIRQVSFNKRRTVPRKAFYADEWPAWEAVVASGIEPNAIPAPAMTHGKVVTFVKQERRFSMPPATCAVMTNDCPLHPASVTLTIKDKWWFGPALWDMAFIRPHWRLFTEQMHNFFNDKVLYKRIDPSWDGRPWPAGVAAATVEQHIGTYLWGRIGDPRMVVHSGHGDSIWKGEYQERMRREGKELIGKQGIEEGRLRA